MARAVVLLICILHALQADESPPNLLPKNCDNASENSYLALLTYKIRKTESEKILCAGTVIHENFVLTAASCVVIQPYVNLTGVRVKTNGTVDTAMIVKKIVHNGYHRYKPDNDIALLKVAGVNFTKPICLPNSTDTKYFYLTGWAGSGEDFPDLERREITGVDDEDCEEKYEDKGYNVSGESQICAGVKKDGFYCTRDAGGPLLTEEGQVGVASFGPKKCAGDSPFPNIYTRISYYMDWILTHIQR